MDKLLITASLIVLATIVSGIYMVYNNTDGNKKRIRKALQINLFVFVPVIVFALITFIPAFAMAAPGAATEVNGLGLIAAALSTGLAAIGAGYAVGVVGSAALGAISEDPSMLGKTLIFAGLAEGIAIYGLIISMIILGKL